MTIEWISEELEAIRSRDLYRSLRILHTPQRPLIGLDGREVLNFSSNDYLGLCSDPRLVKAVQAGAWSHGAGSGSARLISGNLEVMARLEKALAEFVGAERTLLFTSGYHANLGAIASLAGKEDAVFSDRLNHASIIDGCRLSRARINIYEHTDMNHLGEVLEMNKDARRKLVVTETVFSMDGDMAPLPELIWVCRKHGAMIMVDEAHALGVSGPRGAGALDRYGIAASEVDAVMGTLGKSLGGSGAFIGGSAELIEYLVNRARTFIFTTGPAPALAAAGIEALRIIKEEPWRREKVLSLAGRLRSALEVMGFHSGDNNSAIVPAVIGDAAATMDACAALLERGIFVQGIRPPTVPEGTSRLRINLSAAHDDDQLDRLIAALGEVL